MKHRILVIENSNEVTGALTSILRSCSILSSEFEFCFLIPSRSNTERLIEEAGFEVIRLPMSEIRKQPLALLVYLPLLIVNAVRLRKWIKARQISLLINNDFYNLLPPALKLLGLKTPYVTYVRFLPDRFPKILRWLWFHAHAQYASFVIAVSTAVANQLPLSKKKCVIGHEVPEHIIPSVPPDHKLILYPSNYIPGKGQDHAVESFSQVAKLFPPWKIRFIGSDMGLKKNRTYKNNLVARAQELGIAEQVQWLPFSDLDKHYRECSFVLMLSDSESFSMICLEAMAAGRTVIATRCGGPSEIISHDRDGLLVEVANYDDMATNLKRLMSDHDLVCRLGEAAAKSVRMKFSVENTVFKIGTCLRDAIIENGNGSD